MCDVDDQGAGAKDAVTVQSRMPLYTFAFILFIWPCDTCTKEVSVGFWLMCLRIDLILPKSKTHPFEADF
jgi:hypothetical protein